MAKCNRKQRLLGKSIRRIRMRRNMTQRELANAAGLGESAFRSYELGERSPKQNTLERIAKALDVAPACFDTYGIEHYDELMHALFLSEEALQDGMVDIRPRHGYPSDNIPVHALPVIPINSRELGFPTTCAFRGGFLRRAVW